MVKRIFFTILLSISTLMGYSVGDKIDKDVADKLNITNDKVYIVDFFASWCASCKIELPLISKLDSTIDKSKYKIIGVNSDKNIEKGKSFVKNLNLKFDIVYDNNNKLISAFAPIGVPAIYYIKNMKIQKVIFGAVHDIDKKIVNDLKSIGE